MKKKIISEIKSTGGQKDKLSKSVAFTLTEVLLAVLIVGVISAIVIPAVITHYQNKLFPKSNDLSDKKDSLAYTRVVNTVLNSVNTLVANENTNFFKTYMYLDSAPESYDDYSGKFLKKYFKVSKFCGDDGTLCFASTYHEFKDKDKVVYTPDLTGSCAKLKDGVSICLKPQIGETPIQGIIDLNGEKGPNIFGRDLVTFKLPVKTKLGFDTTTADVGSVDGPVFDEDILECYQNPDSLKCCQRLGLDSNNINFCCGLSEYNNIQCCDYNGVTETNHGYCCGLEVYKNTTECCKYKTITSISDPCCENPSIKASVSACQSQGSDGGTTPELRKHWVCDVGSLVYPANYNGTNFCYWVNWTEDSGRKAFEPARTMCQDRNMRLPTFSQLLEIYDSPLSTPNPEHADEYWTDTFPYNVGSYTKEEEICGGSSVRCTAWVYCVSDARRENY